MMALQLAQRKRPATALDRASRCSEVRTPKEGIRMSSKKPTPPKPTTAAIKCNHCMNVDMNSDPIERGFYAFFAQQNKQEISQHDIRVTSRDGCLRNRYERVLRAIAAFRTDEVRALSERGMDLVDPARQV